MRLRRGTLAITLAIISLSAPLAAQQPVDPTTGKVEGETTWFDIQALGVEGQAWKDVKAPFDRLPARAEESVRDAVWNLSRDSAGMCVRFATDSPAVHCRWTLTSANLAMPHMAATGVSGVDLYVNTDDGWRWLATGRPTQQANTAALVTGLSRQRREFCLYLPLYNGVSSVEIGVAKETALEPLPRDEKRARPIVFWGTSITQGGCASRTGMVHTAI